MARPNINGERVHVMLTTPQLKYLDKQSERTGLSRSDLVRRALDAQIHRDKRAAQK